MNPPRTAPHLNPDLGRPVRLLLVEDSPSDAAMTVAAFEEGRIFATVVTVRDGEEAMAYLRGAGEYAGSPRPDLILLDLNLPRKDGREVLAEAKNDDVLRSIPIIVLTSSAAEKDIVSAYRNFASAYITKPVEFEDFLEAVRGIEHFWLSLVRLPHTTGMSQSAG